MNDYTPRIVADLAPIRDDFVPASDFTGPHIPRLEKAKLWPRVWQVACREEEVPRIGDYGNFQLFDESIIIVLCHVTRSRDSTIRVSTVAGASSTAAKEKDFLPLSRLALQP